MRFIGFKGATAYEAAVVIRGHEFCVRFPHIRPYLLCGTDAMVAHVTPDGVWKRRQEIPLLPRRLIPFLRRFAYSKAEAARRAERAAEFDAEVRAGKYFWLSVD
jgi:hypothetical protein